MRTTLALLLGFCAALLMGFTITKTWADTETLTHTDLNTTFDEVETRLNAIDDCTTSQLLVGAGANTAPTCGTVPDAGITAGAVDGGSGGEIADNSIDNNDLSLTLDLGGATSFEIPNGTANTVDAAGEIAQDTTADQIVYGATPRVLTYVQQECAVIENLEDTDDSFEVWMTAYAATVTSVGCRCQGTCTTPATFTLEDRAGNAMTITGTNPTCATSGNATYAAVTAGNALVAGEGMAFDVTNGVDPETDKYTLCWTYTVDRQ